MIFRRIGRMVRGAIDAGKNLFNTVKKKVTDIIKDPLGALGKVLDKVPFPKVVKGFLEKFMGSPLAALLPGPIAGIAALLMNAKSVGDVLDIVRGAAGTRGYQEGPPAGRNNILELAAQQHAKLFFPHLF